MKIASIIKLSVVFCIIPVLMTACSINIDSERLQEYIQEYMEQPDLPESTEQSDSKESPEQPDNTGKPAEQEESPEQPDNTEKSAEQEETPTGLAGVYANDFPVGVALPQNVIKSNNKAKDIVTENFNSITCENEMKPDFILDKNACRKDPEGLYEHAAVNFNACQPAIQFALDNNMKMRLHTLVWHSQTPAWFFTEDYTDSGELVTREVMLKRMENYIADVLGYFNENYPGLIYAVDVCNEAFDMGDGDGNGIRKKNNRWYDTVGDDYYYQAFVFARKYAPDDMKLFYNDYGCASKSYLILKRLQQAKDEGLIDGIGMQSHLSIYDRISAQYLRTVKEFCDAGYEVQVTELDIGMKSADEKNLAIQAGKYKILFGSLKELKEEGYNITGITVWGLGDALTWRAGEYPLLFDSSLEKKPAYFGAMLDELVAAEE